jgi:serine O-acetyltransferase
MPRIRLRQLRAYLAADLIRYAGRVSVATFLRHFLFTPGYNYTVWMRTCGWARTHPVLKVLLFPFCKWRLLHSRYKYGIAIPEHAAIGPGLFINRFGGVYIHHDTVIGCNVNITHGTVLGYMNRGSRAGAPYVGDRVFFGSGAKVIGRIAVGNEAAIGVNAVVTKDVPERGVAVGIPGKIVGDGGSDGYINNAAPAELIAASGWAERLALALQRPPSAAE